uniref:Uncharacterized protein n=1 Tax=Anguilla anguilla TaxID=7936 RepID=A0A0E9SL84_ANGAN
MLTSLRQNKSFSELIPEKTAGCVGCVSVLYKPDRSSSHLAGTNSSFSTKKSVLKGIFHSYRQFHSHLFSGPREINSLKATNYGG